MAALLFDHDATVSKWVAQRCGVDGFAAPVTTLGVLYTFHGVGKLCGGFAFTGFNGNSIEVTGAGRGIISRGSIGALLNYVFDQLGCQRLSAHVRFESRAQSLLERLGISSEGVARNYFGNGDDAICYALTVQEVPGLKARLGFRKDS